MSLPQRKFLLIVTVGLTHASPVLELGKVLAERGHIIEFATFDGQDEWLIGYPFVSRCHFLGPGPDSTELNAHYERMRLWDARKGFAGAFTSKYLFDSHWPHIYQSLKAIMQDTSTRPDMILADYYVDCAKDMHIQFQIPLAVVWPQFPFGMLPCSYIPGQPGLQVEIALTSEHSSLWSRFRNELVILQILPAVFRYLGWMRRMRRKAGVYYMLPVQSKPDYLVLVNSFFGLEVPRDIPPLAAAVGPILADEYPALSIEYSAFLEKHRKTVYVAFGTRILLPLEQTDKILNGLISALQSKLIDGVIWSLSNIGRRELPRDQVYRIGGGLFTFGELLDGQHPDWIFPAFARQRAILEHQSTQIYFTHGGGSSANEGSYHGKKMLCMPFSFDQLSNSARLAAAGTAESLDKITFKPSDVSEKLELLVKDSKRNYERNVNRMRIISGIASRRKFLAADLVEEVLFDTELRMVGTQEVRPMHLETADMRMSMWKAKNWDLVSLGIVGVSIVAGGLWWLAART